MITCLIIKEHILKLHNVTKAFYIDIINNERLGEKKIVSMSGLHPVSSKSMSWNKWSEMKGI